jgi:uncharacterized protein YbjT (DUF2867 family)
MSNKELYVVTGVSGRTGSSAASALLNAGKQVRVVVRDKTKGELWIARGAEVAIADISDTQALSNALLDATGAYFVSPPQYSIDNLFEQAAIMARSIANAAKKAQLPKLVVLSSIGAEQSHGTGWIGMNHMLEQHLSQAGLVVTFLRAAYFMENWAPLAKIAATQYQLSSFLAPLNKKFPMIATADIGRIAAEVLCETWDKTRIIELEGPVAYSPDEVAEHLALSLEKAISSILIPESHWSQSVSGQGFSTTAIAGFIEMTQGLNSEHIAFNDHANIERRQGTVSLGTVIDTMSIE